MCTTKAPPGTCSGTSTGLLTYGSRSPIPDSPILPESLRIYVCHIPPPTRRSSRFEHLHGAFQKPPSAARPRHEVEYFAVESLPEAVPQDHHHERPPFS